MSGNTRLDGSGVTLIGGFLKAGADRAGETSHHFRADNGQGWISLVRNAAGLPIRIHHYVDLHKPSDRRLKKDNVRITGALDTIDQLNGYKYRMIDSNTPSVGVIAQEVQAVLPELTSVGSGPEHMLSVNYEGLTPVLIEAVKELKSENAALSESNRDLEAKYADLLLRIQRLEEGRHDEDGSWAPGSGADGK